MPEHYTKNTVQAPVWCPKCNAITSHMVLNGRRGGCIPCLDKQQAEAQARPPAQPEKQGRLF